MEQFCMRCPKCGESLPITMNLSEGEQLEIKEGAPAPSTLCICGAVQLIPPGVYKGTFNGTIRVEEDPRISIVTPSEL
ncbi:MAG: hypothetical protein PHX93_03510 [Candidatus Peribacteraceae bacterium]|nr:hypothetical protein [Candidatus Peribacteraceae bacterium]